MANDYRKAAKYFEDHPNCLYVCEALGYTLKCIGFAKVEDHPALQMLKPKRLAKCGGFWSLRDRDSRILALCFMAAITERP